MPKRFQMYVQRRGADAPSDYGLVTGLISAPIISLDKPELLGLLFSILTILFTE